MCIGGGKGGAADSKNALAADPEGEIGDIVFEVLFVDGGSLDVVFAAFFFPFFAVWISELSVSSFVGVFLFLFVGLFSSGNVGMGASSSFEGRKFMDVDVLIKDSAVIVDWVSDGSDLKWRVFNFLWFGVSNSSTKSPEIVSHIFQNFISTRHRINIITDTSFVDSV